MKLHIYILFFVVLFFTTRAQDTTRVLFIGNSFTYYNNMPQIFKELAGAANIPVITAMHAPGGVSVGDVAQGNMAHMNNPALFSLIRSQKWDYAVIQDNQGRFILDSAQFPSIANSLVIKGHLNIMDSVKANNSCAKIILFGGWGLKPGMPPYGNTGIQTIKRILTNYYVLNTTMKETVAPIGAAWIKAINYLPAVNLWDPDDAHPSYPGSFLTASVIFSTIFNQAAKNINYNGTLAAPTAFNLRAFADTTVFDLANHMRYNLGGARRVSIQPNGGQLTVPGIYSSYTWYKNNVAVATTPTLNISGNGVYRAEVVENDLCIVKTCNYTALTTGTVATGIENEAEAPQIQLYPNPVNGGQLTVISETTWDKIELYNMAGVRETLTIEALTGQTQLSLNDLKPGCYVLVLSSEGQILRKKIMVTE